MAKDFGYGTITLFGQDFSDRSPIPPSPFVSRSYNPGRTNRPVWALPRSLAATKGISVDFFSCGYMRCFSSPRSPLKAYIFSQEVTGFDPRRVTPFGNLRITGRLRLPEAYRSLPRPSSLPGAKASTLGPSLLDLHFPFPAKPPRQKDNPRKSRGLAPSSFGNSLVKEPQRPRRRRRGFFTKPLSSPLMRPSGAGTGVFANFSTGVR